MTTDPLAAGPGGAGQADTGLEFVRPPAVALPRGGGAIRGIGEKFSVETATGTAALAIPIGTSAGRAGFGPKLNLGYDSGSGNGLFGFGWTLHLPAITRKTDKGVPRYDDACESDVFLLSGTDDLVPVLDPDTGGYADDRSQPDYVVRRYRPRIEGLFARIERWTHLESGDVHWRSTSHDNITTVYGASVSSRVADPEQPQHVFCWLICETYDDKGNCAAYDYIAEDARGVDVSRSSERTRSRTANRYPRTIRYGNRTPLDRSGKVRASDLDPSAWFFEIFFDYDEDLVVEVPPDPSIDPDAQLARVDVRELSSNASWAARPDPFSSYRAGFELRTHRRCRRILMFHRFPELGDGPVLVRSTDFDYADFEAPARSADQLDPAVPNELAHQGSSRYGSFLKCAAQSGYVLENSGDPDEGSGGLSRYIRASIPPIVLEYSRPTFDTAIRDVQLDSLDGMPEGLDGSRYQLIDLDGEGVPGVLADQADTWLYKQNLGQARFGAMRALGRQPSAVAGAGALQLLDLGADGQLDVVHLDSEEAGFYERDAGLGWQPFKSLDFVPNLSWNDPNLRFVDLTGDGLADVLVTEDDAFTWYASMGEQGFDDARRVRQHWEGERGIRLVFADGTQSIYLADMAGDGLVDLVRIRNGEVCYWPSHGYGRFGAKVTMETPPWLDDPTRMDQGRIRLADIDGSGTTDICYLRGTGVQIYLNQSGNGWSDAVSVNGLPPVDQTASLAVVDLLGKGTACLVWSSPLPGDAGQPLRYVDLLSAGKPHLLTRIVNNLGAETAITYASSTKYFLEDRATGRPWPTRVPFPVHVVERIDTFDRISGGHATNSYTYHDGYFDGVEREFRGFGQVDRLDSEDFADSDVPPSLTRTWFHTGLTWDRPGGGFDFQPSPEICPPEVPAGLLADEEREALRALKGLMLREEVYGKDGSSKEDMPYTVLDQTFAARLIQPRGRNRHAVFLTHPHESVSRHSERTPADPRVRHAMTLEVDEFGNVLSTAAAAYGRRTPNPALGPLDQQTQGRDFVTYTQNSVTTVVDEADAYRTPLPAGSRTYELTGVRAADALWLTIDAVREAVDSAQPLGYADEPGNEVAEARLIEEMRTVYRRNDLSGPLPPGELESLALPYETYRLALTPELVSDVYDGRVSDDMLRGPGGYVQLEGSDDWWVRTGQVFYSPGADDSPADELAFARTHFFLPHRYRDPFHSRSESTESIVVYDHDLLVKETLDPMGNRVTAGERDPDPDRPLVRSGQDYRTLSPTLVMDANRNRSAVAIDALGLVAATAVMGPPEDGQRAGDLLGPSLKVDLTPAEIADFFADPRGPAAAALLDTATTRLVYDLAAYARDPDRAEPVFAAAIVREMHVSATDDTRPSPLQVTFSYSDGFAREVQKKAQAEPDGSRPERERWMGTGWTVFNGKNKPVRTFEPFFSGTHRFEGDVRKGVGALLCYDPLERVVATVHPNHTFEKVVLDPWAQQRWDTSDTVLFASPAKDPDVGQYLSRLDLGAYEPSWYAQRADGQLGRWEAEAAAKARDHAKTPSVAYTDAMGRVFLTIGHNRAVGSRGASDRSGADIFHEIRTRIDVEGNQREMSDALGRVVARFDFNLVGTRLHHASMEAGERWTLGDVTGSAIYSWDSRGNRVRTDLDPLRRPRAAYLQRDGEAPELMVVRTVYGESRRRPERRNLRGKVFRTFDQSGVTTTNRYDFKGNLLRSERRLAANYRGDVDWSSTVDLEDGCFVGQSAFDALNRPIEIVEPDGTQMRATFNEANLLERVEGRLRGVDEVTVFVADISYNAKGQRTRLVLGNGAVTQYGYDPQTFRLTHLTTVRDTREKAAGPPEQRRRRAVQDLGYTYDPVGNVTHIEDGSQQPVFHANARVDASCDYTYDALYRLVAATGREQLGRTSGAPIAYGHRNPEQPVRPDDGTALGRYVERFTYDLANNVTSLEHRGMHPANPGWTRTFDYRERSQLEPGVASNRLSASTVGATTEVFSVDSDGYDPNGAMLAMPHLPSLAWDYKNQLQTSQRQAVNMASPDPDAEDGDPDGAERTWYVYDAGGGRIRKVTERGGRIMHERVYLGAFEIFRRHGAKPLVRETIHIMDDTGRIALVETRTEGRDRAPAQLTRYQIANALGSVNLELDERARIVSYEEFSPYGCTTYEAVKRRREVPKRYRFTGKERDEETGLSYHGARYYAPWLCRWTSSDPSLLADGPNTYTYVSGRPTGQVDPSGRQGDAQEIMQGMMWDRMGWEISGIIEGFFGGSAYVNPRANVVEYSGPKGGVGGVVGGVVRAATLRLVPIEDHASPVSLMGMEVGAGMVPVLDPGARLVCGTTVTGQDTSRGWAAVEFGMDVVPFLLEARAATMEARIASTESRMLSMESRMLTEQADMASHIGAGETRLREPTVTNPTCRGDLCVADVGAHEANLRNPDLAQPITNTDLVSASGRDVSRLESPISTTGEATNFLQDAFEGLYREGKIADPISAQLHLEPNLRPGNYLAHVDGPQGGHALHATVTDEVIGKRYLSEGRFVTKTEADEILENGGRVVERPVYRTEYYDPQNGVCVKPTSEPRGFVRLE